MEVQFSFAQCQMFQLNWVYVFKWSLQLLPITPITHLINPPPSHAPCLCVCSCACPFCTHREHVRDRRRRDEQEFGMILRRLRGSLLCTVTEWLLYAKKRSRLRRLRVSMLLRVLARYCASAFRQWKMVCGGMSAFGASYANLLARCFTRCLADHLQAWSEHALASAQRSRTMIRAASTWLHHRLRSANCQMIKQEHIYTYYMYIRIFINEQPLVEYVKGLSVYPKTKTNSHL